MIKKAIAFFMPMAPDAIGLFFFVGCFLSFSISTKSFITYTADAIRQKERKEIGKKDTYIRDVKKEMSMVRWPSAKEVIKYSIASLVFVAFFALFFYGIDAIFALVKDLIS